MIKLENITSICEVSLTANFVLGYLLLKYMDVRHKSTSLILKETQSIELCCNDNLYVFRNGNRFSVKAFNRIETLFTISGILATIAILTSFSVLLFTGAYPDYEISPYLYIFFSLLFIIVNPIVYFIAEISVINFQRLITERSIKEDEISELVKIHISMPVYHVPILRKIRWFFYFKIQYTKSILKKMVKLR